MGFLGQIGGTSDSLCKFIIEEQNQKNQMIFSHNIDVWCFASPVTSNWIKVSENFFIEV